MSLYPDNIDYEITSYDNADEDSSLLIPIDKDLLGKVSSYTQAIPQLAVSKIGYEALNQTAYSIKFNGETVLPNQLYRKKNGSYISNLKGEDKSWGKQTDVDPLDFTREKGAMIAGAAFAAASVATSQYYLKNIDEKLEELQKITKQVLEFLEQEKQSEIEAEIKFLSEVFNSMSLIKDDDALRQSKLNQISSIERESTANIIFYEKEIKKLINEYGTKRSKKKNEQEIINRLMSAYYYLNLSSRANALAKLLEVYMVDGLKKQYIQNKREEIQSNIIKVTLINDLIATTIPERDNKKFSALIRKGVSGALNYLGDSVELSPFGVYSMDEKFHELSYIEGGKTERDSDEKVARILEYGEDSSMDSYLSSIKQVEFLYDNPVELVYKNDEMYLKIPKAV